MNTVNKVKKRILICGVIVFVLVGSFFSYRHGWRLFGFRYCTDPQYLTVWKLDIQDEYVYLSGAGIYSMTSYLGYVYSIENDILYVGIKTRSELISFGPRNALFQLEIPTEGHDIQKVILTNKDSEREIRWNEAEGNYW